MAMTGIENRNSPGKIDIAFAFNVPYFAVQRPCGNHWGRVPDPTHDGIPAALEDRSVRGFHARTVHQ